MVIHSDRNSNHTSKLSYIRMRIGTRSSNNKMVREPEIFPAKGRRKRRGEGNSIGIYNTKIRINQKKTDRCDSHFRVSPG